MRLLEKYEGQLRFIILILIAFDLVSWVIVSSPSFQTCIATETRTTVPSIYRDCLDQLVNAEHEAITALATAFLTLVTGGLVFVGYRQITSARSEARAYLLPDQSGVFEGSVMTPPQTTHINEPGVILVIKNFGHTPALRVISWAQISVEEPRNEHTLVAPPLEEKYPLTLGGNATFSKAIWFGRALTSSEIADIPAQRRMIYLYGRIEYVDIFKQSRITNFRLYYSGQFPPQPGAIFRFCEKGNDST